VRQDSRFSGRAFDEVAFAMSRDGGRTWPETIRVSQTPVNESNPLRQQAFIPSVVIAGDGTVGVTYYDFRNDVDGVPELTDHWLMRFGKSCSNPRHWKEVRLTEESFDYLEAPEAGGLFLGDYVGPHCYEATPARLLRPVVPGRSGERVLPRRRNPSPGSGRSGGERKVRCSDSSSPCVCLGTRALRAGGPTRVTRSLREDLQALLRPPQSKVRRTDNHGRSTVRFWRGFSPLCSHYGNMLASALLG
jgi:hypothetical protein